MKELELLQEIQRLLTLHKRNKSIGDGYLEELEDLVQSRMKKLEEKEKAQCES